MGTVCPQGHDSASSDFCTVCGTRVSSSPPRPEGMTGKHHAPGRFVASVSEACPRCGEAVTGQFCEACGFRVSARRPFAPLGHDAGASPAAPAEAREMSPSGPAPSGPPASLFPPVPKPEPLFSPASRTPPPAPAPSPSEPPTGPLVRAEPAPAPPVASAPPTTPIPSLSSVTWTVLVASDRVYYNRMKASRAVAGSAVEFPAHTSERRVRLVGIQMRIGRRSAARDLVPEIDLADQPVDPGVSRLHAVLTSAPDGTWFISDPGSANGTFVNSRELAIGERVTLHEGDRINLGAWTVITVHRG
jgi:FHA domain